MGTRTYSRRAANGTRVLTALGRARAGIANQDVDIFGEPIETPTPTPTAQVPTPTPAPVVSSAPSNTTPLPKVTNKGGQKVIDILEKMRSGAKPVVRNLTPDDFRLMSAAERATVEDAIYTQADSMNDQFGEIFLDVLNPTNNTMFNKTPAYQQAKTILANIETLVKLRAMIEQRYLAESQPNIPPPGLIRITNAERPSFFGKLNGAVFATFRDAVRNDDPRIPDYYKPNNSYVTVGGVGGGGIRQAISSFIQSLS